MVILLPALLLVTIPAARAHGDDHLLIDALTGELARAPDANLFIRRGEFFRRHREWEKAEADFVVAARLEPGLALVDFFRARALLESGAPAQARPLIDRYVAKAPGEAEGWFLRGEILAGEGQPAAAATDYSEGIRLSSTPRPEHYLRCAQLLAARGTANNVAAVAVLDEGIARLGPVITLHESAIAFELGARQYDRALERLRVVIDQMPRRETWLVRRAEILLAAGRTGEAVGTYREALAAVDQLPVRYQQTDAVKTLVATVRDALARLANRAAFQAAQGSFNR